MATPPVPSKSFLTQKWGPIPVWGYGLGSLGAAYLWSRYRAKKAAASSAATTTPAPAAGEPNASAPYFVIDNNLPPGPVPPSAPIPSPTGQPPVSGPPSTTPSPPTNTGPPPVTGSTDGTAPAPRPHPTPTPVTTPHTIPGSTYKVVAGDTLTTIAIKNRVPGGATALWAYQLDPKNNPPAQIATLRQRGPNFLLPGETIRIPPRTA